jgi:hypothetical protein
MSYVHSLERESSGPTRARSPACTGTVTQNVPNFHIFRLDFLIDMSALLVLNGYRVKGNLRALAIGPLVRDKHGKSIQH